MGEKKPQLNHSLSWFSTSMDVGAVQRLVGELHKRAKDGSRALDDGYPTSELQQIGFFILFFFLIMAFCVWALRIYGRFLTKQHSWGELMRYFILKTILTIC